MSRRDQIKMDPAEVDAFLEARRVAVCATNGPRGWPHLMPLWYTIRERELWAWTYAKSQKVRNLERDPRATLQLEAGERYEELRGVMIEARAVIHRDTELVSKFGRELFSRYYGTGSAASWVDVVRAQAPKRVALQFAPQRVVSWDHRKLAGVY